MKRCHAEMLFEIWGVDNNCTTTDLIGAAVALGAAESMRDGAVEVYTFHDGSSIRVNWNEDAQDDGHITVRNP